MGVTVTECVVEVAVETAEQTHEAGEAQPRRGSAATEADRVRRQQLVRRKAKLARHALAANRGR